MNGKITVCIPTFNRPQGLKRAIESVLNQSNQCFEVLIADNCSPDPRVQEVIASYLTIDARIQSFRHETNIGAIGNFDFLLSKVQTDLFIWLGDDDYWSKNFLEVLLNHMLKDVLLVFSDVTCIDIHGKREEFVFLDSFKDCVTDEQYLSSWSLRGEGYPTYGLFNLAKCRDKNVAFDFDKELCYFNEGVFLHQLFLTGGVRFAKDATLYYSTTSIKPEQADLISSFFEYTKKLTILYVNTTKVDKKLRDKILSQILTNHLQYIKTLCEIAPTWTKKTELKSFLGKIKKTIIPIKP
jgi:glycosyltransferase involved in cell wall biosynthesis